MANFTGKVAIVTGGSSGIGRATAILFAQNGAKVVIAARDPERGGHVADEIHDSDGEAMFVPTDVSKAHDAEELVRITVERYGRLDYAINNAATPGSFRETADFSEEEFDETIAIDLKGVWLGMKFQIKQMLAQHPTGGSIVNTSSVNGLGGARMGAVYSAAKAGIHGLTKSAALEYGTRGIRINALVAGGFETPMLDNAMEHISRGDIAARQKLGETYKKVIALGRIGSPSEAAQAIAWLCSEASSYVTGHSLIVDGGLSAPYR